MKKENSKERKGKKEEVEIENKKKKPDIPFLQVDKGGSFFSNFVSNFLKQFKNQKGHGLMGLLSGLWQSRPKPDGKLAQPADIMGPIQNDSKLAIERRENWQKNLQNASQKRGLSQADSLKKNTAQEIIKPAATAKKSGLKM